MKSANRKKSVKTALLLLLILSLTVSAVGCSRLSFVPDQGTEGETPTDTAPGDDLPAITPPTQEAPVYYNR